MYWTPVSSLVRLPASSYVGLVAPEIVAIWFWLLCVRVCVVALPATPPLVSVVTAFQFPSASYPLPVAPVLSHCWAQVALPSVIVPLASVPRLALFKRFKSS